MYLFFTIVVGRKASQHGQNIEPWGGLKQQKTSLGSTLVSKDLESEAIMGTSSHLLELNGLWNMIYMIYFPPLPTCPNFRNPTCGTGFYCCFFLVVLTAPDYLCSWNCPLRVKCRYVARRNATPRVVYPPCELYLDAFHLRNSELLLPVANNFCTLYKFN